MRHRRRHRQRRQDPDADLALAASEFGDQLNQICAPAARRQALIDLLINIRLADKAATDGPTRTRRWQAAST